MADLLAAAKLLAALSIAVAAQLPVAWLVMLLVGIVHAEWLATLPTVGYPTALLICLVVMAVSAVRVFAAVAVRVLAGTDKDKLPKTVTMHRESPTPVTNPRRVHWANVNNRRHL